MSEFNEKQHEAINHIGSPCLVLASAGTGKTAVLTEKFANAVERGIDPSQIMAVTFTKKAAAEMKARIRKRLNLEDVSDLWIGTFHSLSSRILECHPKHIGFDGDFGVIDKEEQEYIISRILTKANIHRDVNDVMKEIDRVKNDGIDLSYPYRNKDEAPYIMKENRSIIDLYQHTLYKMHLVDYGDQIVKTITLFEDNAFIHRGWRKKFKLVMIDEYQDTNKAQQKWCQMIASEDQSNAFCVADDDQSIYRFRGAYPEGLINFETEWKNPKIIRLELNYRCPPKIVEKASKLIAHNGVRFSKSIIAATDREGDIYTRPYFGTRELYDVLRDHIADIVSLGQNYSDISILVRTNAEVNDIVEILNASGIPAATPSNEAVRNNAINMLIAWVRLILNDRDDSALTRIIKFHGHEIPKELVLLSEIRQTSIIKAYNTQKLTNGVEIGFLSDIITKIEKIRLGMEFIHPVDLIPQIVEASECEKLADEGTDQEKYRYWRFFGLMINYAQHHPRLKDIISYAQNDMIDPDMANNEILVSTMHGMKGLQSKSIITIGWEQGKFPHARATQANLEETRRLAYVTLTRAGENAWIFYDGTKPQSRFIEELEI
jgi:DNA helicase II / ATP-dependent DNA helicase PcrA